MGPSPALLPLPSSDAMLLLLLLMTPPAVGCVIDCDCRSDWVVEWMPSRMR